MNRIIAVSAIALSVATGAQAYTDAPATLVNQVGTILTQNNFEGVDVQALTDNQISQIYLIGTSTDSEVRKLEQLRGVLEGGTEMSQGDMAMTTEAMPSDAAASTMTPGSMNEVIRNALDQYGFETPVSDLTDAQKAGIYIEATSAPHANKRQSIEAILR